MNKQWLRKKQWLTKSGVIVGIMVIGLFAGGQQAFSGPGNGPCADDAAKFCKDMQPGAGRMGRCLNEHEKDLSPACREHHQRMKERFSEAQASCQDDIQKFCGDVKPGQGRVRDCLKEHSAQVSADCKSHLERAPKGK